MFANICARAARRGNRCDLLRGALLIVMAGLWTAPAQAQQFQFTCCFGGMPAKCPGVVAPGLEEPPLDVFLAIEQGRIDARMIVRDPFHARLLLENKSLQAMSVRLPNVLAARPVLAQFGLGQGNGQGMGQSVGQTGSITPPQTVGASTSSASSSQSSSGNNPFNFFNGGAMNNVFNIAPEQVRIVELRCLCLEQGKPNPRAAVKYELVPLAEVNDNPQLAEVLTVYGRGEADRDVAQAAAWHLAGEMSWDQLARLSQKIALNASRPIFNSQQLRQAKQLVEREPVQAAKSQPVKVERQASIKPPRL